MDSDQLQQWLEQQQLHWQNLAKGAAEGAGDWQSVLDSCSKLAEQQNEQQAQLTASMAHQIQGFNKYAERLFSALQSGAVDDLESTVDALTSHLHQQAGEAFYRDWQPPEALQQLIHHLGLSPSSFSSFPFLHRQFERRQGKHKQQLEQLEQALKSFSAAFSGYTELQNRINQQSARRLLEQLKSDAVDAPESLQQLQSLWIDCYEHCYRQQLLTQEYQQAYGELSNALLELQRQARHYWQDEYRAFGLVPFHDYDQLLKQQHSLRKNHRQAQRRISELEQLLDQQQQRLDRIEQQLAKGKGRNRAGSPS